MWSKLEAIKLFQNNPAVTNQDQLGEDIQNEHQIGERKVTLWLDQILGTTYDEYVAQ